MTTGEAIKGLYTTFAPYAPTDQDFGSFFCGLGCATDHLAPFLERWIEVEPADASGLAPALVPAGPVARSGLEPGLGEEPTSQRLSSLLHLAAMLRAEGHHFLALRNAFWPASAKQVVERWLASPALARVLERAVYTYYDDPVAEELANAHDHLGWYGS